MTPELAYLEAKFAGLVSYGLSAGLLAEVLPLGRGLHAAEVRRRTHAVAGRQHEGELGPEPGLSIVVGPLPELPRPDLAMVVGLDGGFVHSAHQRSRRDGWFEVIAGKAVPAEGRARCFGFVQTYDAKPRRRLYELLQAQGMQLNQQVTFLTDGGDDVRDLPMYLNPGSEHLLDWFHITMRLTVLTQMAKGLPPAVPRDHESDDEQEEDEDLVDVAHELGGAQVVPLARQRLPGSEYDRLAGRRPVVRALRIGAGQAHQGARRVRGLHLSQPLLDPELRRAPPRRRDDLDRLR